MKKLAGLCAAMAALGLVACGGSGQPEQDTGSIELTIAGPATQQAAGALKQALVVGAPNLTVASVKVTFTSGAFTRVETPPFTSFPVSYSALGLPAGTYTVLAQALSASGAVLFEVAEDDVPVSDRTVTALNLLMQQVPDAGTVHAQAPYISAIVISSGYPAAINKPVSLSASVVLPPDATSPRYAWTVACVGEPSVPSKFSNEAATDTNLTLTACASDATVTFKASAHIPGAGELTSSVSFVVDYDPQGIAGQLRINRWPNITDMVVGGPAMNVQPTPGARLPAVVAANDLDGDALTYQWESSCGGAFTDVPNQPFAKFWTVPASLGPCVLQVTVSDGRGGSTVATFTLNITETPIWTAVTNLYPDNNTTGSTVTWNTDGGVTLTKVDPATAANIALVGPTGQTLSSLSFDVAEGSQCGGGAPRFIMTFGDSSTYYFFSCEYASSVVGTTRSFVPADAWNNVDSTRGVPAALLSQAMKNVEIVMDVAGASATISNIRVNGSLVVHE